MEVPQTECNVINDYGNMKDTYQALLGIILRDYEFFHKRPLKPVPGCQDRCHLDISCIPIISSPRRDKKQQPLNAIVPVNTQRRTLSTSGDYGLL